MLLIPIPANAHPIDAFVVGFLLRPGKGKHRLLVGSGFKGRQWNGNTGAFRKLGGASLKMPPMPRCAVTRCRKRFPNARVPTRGTRVSFTSVSPRQFAGRTGCVICS